MPPKALRFALLGGDGAICLSPIRCPNEEEGAGELLRNPPLPGLGVVLPRNPPLPGLGAVLPRNPPLPGLPGLLGAVLPRNPLLPGLGAEPRNPPVDGAELRNPPWGPGLFRGAKLARTPPLYC